MKPVSEKRLEKITQVVAKRQKDFVLVLEDVHDPHNAAAILRTCDAFGVPHIHYVFDTVEAYDPKKVGKVSSSSANKWLNFTIHQSTKDCFKSLKDQGYTIVATALTDESISFYDYTFSDKKVALVMGNEHAGVSKYVLDNADAVIKLPMNGFVESLNVSVAAALFIYEVSRQRLVLGTNNFLAKEEQSKLIEDFTER